MLSDKAQSLIEFSRINGRICPQPMRWKELWDLLPSKIQKSSGSWEPPLPPILGAWGYARGLEKISRLRDHLQWADEHGVIDDIDTFLRGLPEENWFHGND